jgi:hypothetical protein
VTNYSKLYSIITSLPNFLSNFASSLLANARLHAATNTVDPDQLISLISEEYNCSVSQRMRRSAKSSSKSNDKDEAMLASSNGKGKRERKPHGVCWNCRDKGHFKDKCPKPAKDTKNDSSKKGGSVRGHPSISLLPLSSPTLHLFICNPPHRLYTIFKDHTHSRRLSGPMVRRLPRSRLTNSRRLPVSPPARTSTASDELRMHWDEST